jgi:hypothetical protein
MQSHHYAIMDQEYHHAGGEGKKKGPKKLQHALHSHHVLVRIVLSCSENYD